MSDRYKNIGELGVALDAFRQDLTGQISTLKWIMGIAFAISVGVAGLLYSKLDAVEVTVAANAAILQRLSEGIEIADDTLSTFLVAPIAEHDATNGLDQAPAEVNTYRSLSNLISARDGSSPAVLNAEGPRPLILLATRSSFRDRIREEDLLWWNSSEPTTRITVGGELDISSSGQAIPQNGSWLLYLDPIPEFP